MSYSKDLRERAVKYRLNGHTLEETSEIFNVGKSAVSRWVKQYKEKGDLSNKPLNREYKKINPEKLKDYVKKHPDAYQREIAEEFNCSIMAVSKALKRLGITRKKRQNAIMSKKKNYSIPNNSYDLTNMV